MKSDNNLRKPADSLWMCDGKRETHQARDSVEGETENTSATINATCGHGEMYFYLQLNGDKVSTLSTFTARIQLSEIMSSFTNAIIAQFPP